jgi:hypothetical protein
VIVRFVNIGGIVDHHLFKVMFGLLILVELLTVTCLGDVRFVNIGGIVDHHLNK